VSDDEDTEPVADASLGFAEARSDAEGIAQVDDRALPPGADPSLDWGLCSHLDAAGAPRIIERWLEVPADLAGLRLDHFIKTQIPRLSRTKIQDIIATQLASASGRASLKPASPVIAGERLVIRRPARPEPPCPRTFAVVHADARVLVVDKPAFLPVHASAKFYFNTLARVLAERYPDDGELALCHRLDRETSGCLAVARDRAAASAVQTAIADKARTTKQYLAVVHGVPPWSSPHALDTPLRLSTAADATRVPTVRVLPDPAGLPSTTIVQLQRASADRGYALVACTLVTGRQHQIRVHLAHAGYPIVGDKLYAHGDDAFVAYCERGLTPELAARFVLPRHALHAAQLRFPHPDGGIVDARAELPAELARLVDGAC
jgi:23S rRNA pseudouridine1911/1915/1917 synthase